LADVGSAIGTCVGARAPIFYAAAIVDGTAVAKSRKDAAVARRAAVA
jgi:hypothetical protein